MNSKLIEVGRKYIARISIDDHKPMPVTVISKYKKEERRMSGAGGMPSLSYVTKQYFDVRLSNGGIVMRVEPRDFRIAEQAALCGDCDNLIFSCRCEVGS
jgi:hypothetical protein